MSNPSFFNRELSWIAFNERVLGEGLRKDLPPLERFKYLSIVSSNFDEFFMVRVAAIKRIREAGGETDPSGLGTSELIEKINSMVRSIIDRQFDALTNEVFPALARGGLCFRRPSEWSAAQHNYLESFFLREIFPILTPLRLKDDEPLPAIENYSIYAAFLLEPESHSAESHLAGINPSGVSPGEEYISLIRIPKVPERIVWLPR